MCGTSERSATTTKEKDPLDEGIRRIAINQGLDILNQSYPGYDWSSRVSRFNPDQMRAFGLVRDWATDPNSNIKSERIVDENGRLGEVADYISPYVSGALEPALRDIQKAGAQQRIGIAGNATAAGAFGDARHGIVESEQMNNELQNIGDVTARAYADAYNQAMGQRATDLDRFLSTETLNNQQTLNRYLSLLGIGDQQQQREQALRDARYEEFQNAREWPFRQFDIWPSLISGTPLSQTTTTSEPNNWLFQALGAGLGGIIS